MSEKNLSNIENGRQFPQVNNFLRIIQVLNLSLEDFGVRKNINDIKDNLKSELITKILSNDNNKLNLYNKAINLIDETISSNK